MASGTVDVYPERESHFAHKFVRLLFKACVAQQIGVDAVILLIAIAHTEDAKRYRAPVTYFNSQLLPILGFAKWERLDRARKAACDAGWLHYEGGGTKRPGVYWVVIPKKSQGLDDAPLDEGADCLPARLSPAEGDSGLTDCKALYPSQGYSEGDNEGYSEGDNEGEHSTLVPIPIPDPCSELATQALSQHRNRRGALTDFAFPVVGSKRHPSATEWTLSAAKLAEWRESFPDLDVEAEMVAARQWCRDNSRLRKTSDGMERFLGTWLRNAQNKPWLRAGKAGATSAASSRRRDPRGTADVVRQFTAMFGEGGNGDEN